MKKEERNKLNTQGFVCGVRTRQLRLKEFTKELGFTNRAFRDRRDKRAKKQKRGKKKVKKRERGRE
jgi:hypothetical protein